MRLGRHRQPPGPLRGEVLPGGDRLPGVRHRDGVPLPLGAQVPRALLRRARSTRATARRGVSFFGLGEILVFMGILDRRARLCVAQARRRLGVRRYHGLLLDFATTRAEADAINWARKFSLFQYPFVTACCGMEFMSVAAPKYDIARFGAEFPRFSPRQADLLIIVGTITERQGPALRRIYEQMCEPKWVVAFGVCASTGGFYQNYSTMPGADQVDPGRRLHPRLPAAPRAGARRPDPAAGADPARRGAQPGRDRRRERAREGRKLGKPTTSAGLDPPDRAREAAAQGEQVVAQIVLDRLAAKFTGGESSRPARSTATSGRASGATPGWRSRRSCATTRRRRWRCSST